MPVEACPKHEEQYTECKSKGKRWMMDQCCLNFHSFDKRSLGNMKVEYKDTAQILLTSISYFCSREQRSKFVKVLAYFRTPLF